jgi:hypothetical protein
MRLLCSAAYGGRPTASPAPLSNGGSAAAVAGVLLYLGAKALGLSIPAFLLQAITQSGSRGEIESSPGSAPHVGRIVIYVHRYALA